MTGSSVLLDTWAWWEILSGSSTGDRLRRRYLEAPNRRVHTSVITVAELSIKLAALGQSNRVPAIVASLRAFSELQDVTPEIAQAAGPLRSELRRRAPQAGLADALALATAQRLGARLVSADAAFRTRRGASRF